VFGSNKSKISKQDSQHKLRSLEAVEP